MPTKTLRKLRYSDNITLDLTASSAASHIYRANSLYDPSYTGVGGQPRGFDQLMLFYEHYTVLGAKITARFVNPAATDVAANGILCSVHIDPDNAWTPNLTDIMEQGRYRSAILGSADAKPMRTLSKGVSTKKFLGRSGSITNDPELRGTNAANPTEGIFFILNAMTLDGNFLNDQLRCLVTIDYIALFNEPKQAPAS